MDVAAILGMVTMLMMVVKVVGNPFFVGFRTVIRVPYFSCTEVLRRFLRSFGAQGDNGQSCCVAMGLLMAAEAGPVWSDPVWTWPVHSGRWGGCRGVVGGRRRSIWADHDHVWDKGAVVCY